MTVNRQSLKVFQISLFQPFFTNFWVLKNLLKHFKTPKTCLYMKIFRNFTRVEGQDILQNTTLNINFYLNAWN